MNLPHRIQLEMPTRNCKTGLNDGRLDVPGPPRCPNTMDHILPILSILGYWTIILGTLSGPRRAQGHAGAEDEQRSPAGAFYPNPSESYGLEAPVRRSFSGPSNVVFVPVGYIYHYIYIYIYIHTYIYIYIYIYSMAKGIQQTQERNCIGSCR